MPELRTLFVTGKGGTGKSTACALLAMELVAQGRNVLLASFDDAHNQSDIFEAELSGKACSLGPCLEAVQVDREHEIRRYLDQSVRNVKKSFSYLTAFNLHHYFDCLKLSPGMEEYALVTAFASLHEQYAEFDFMIVDMPPTALAMRFFNLPALSLAWIEQLERLRMEIRKRKEIISTIKFGKKEIERDKILSRIRTIKADHGKIREIFQDPHRSGLLVVLNQDLLSRAETGRIMDQVERLGIHAQGMILNHRMPADAENSPPESVSQGLPVVEIPFSGKPLIGMEVLTSHLRDARLTFAPVLI